jgi:hypothetical protein
MKPEDIPMVTFEIGEGNSRVLFISFRYGRMEYPGIPIHHENTKYVRQYYDVTKLRGQWAQELIDDLWMAAERAKQQGAPQVIHSIIHSIARAATDYPVARVHFPHRIREYRGSMIGHPHVTR